MVTKYPLLRPAIAFATGILIASWLPLIWQVGFIFSALLAVASAFCKTHRTLVFLAVWLIFGGSLFSFRYDVRHSSDLRVLLNGEPELIQITGELNGDPERRVLEQDGNTRYRTTARVSVRQIQRRNDPPQPALGDIAVSTTGFLADEFVAGTHVEIFGVVSKPRGPIAPGLFDFESYLKWQRIFFVLRAETTNDWKLIQQPDLWNAATLYRNFNNWARRTLQRGIPYDENTRLLWAMVLGWKPGLTNEISEPFMRTGTLHVFAISGMHIAMIAGILVNALRWLRLSRNWAGGIAIPLIWFYTGATGWQASAIRSTIMCSVIIFGWLLKRPNNLLNSLAASAVLIFVWQPEQLFQTGFQLSFILLLSFAVWPGLSPNTPWPDPSMYLGYVEPEEFGRTPDLNRWTLFMAKTYEKLTGRDPLLPAELRPRWRQRLDPVVRGLLGGLNVSLASLLGSLPVIAQYFNLISFSSLLANLVIVPLSGIALALSTGSLVLGWIPFLPEAFNFVSWKTMWLMVAICRNLESFTWTYEYVQAPGAFVVIAYYLGILALLNGRYRIAIASAAIVLSIPLWREATTHTVTVLPGTGIIYVDAPWSRNDLLVDCGRNHEVATIVKPFLRSRGVDRLNAVALTHGDVAHVEGYSRLVDEFRPKLTYTSGARSRSPIYRRIVRTLEETPSKRRVVAAGDEICGWRVLHPAVGEDFQRGDDEALVLSKTIDGKTITFLSDLGRNGQQALAARGALKSNVVIAGVPNEGEPLRPELMDALKPELIVV
ncbi:MAG TPA: ComEC/Rec2 family competence protein, partial [Verrucomicrobiae bacterium]|nr:ComEC/Rec2 family competence protein [Verrucomicrobiae bacterium]